MLQVASPTPAFNNWKGTCTIGLVEPAKGASPLLSPIGL